MNLINVTEAAEMLRLSKYTIYKYSSQGILPKVKIGNRVSFRSTDLEEFIEKHRVTCTQYSKGGK